MTEDETFIRAIVDSPGDDTPRLVYADWLDDRADPRGRYLRAEMEWAKPWRDDRLPGDASAVSARAAGIDPVWVGRVSRPPVGVCCDHFVMEDTGPELPVDELGHIGLDFGFKLPPEYIAFLLNYNGGHPYPVGPWLPPSADPPGESEYWFYAVSLTPERRRRRNLQFEIDQYLTSRLPRFLGQSPGSLDARSAWYRDFIPICDTPDMICTNVLGVRGPYVGQVTVIDWSVEPCSFDRQWIIPSFTRFLYDFRPPAEFIVPADVFCNRDEREPPPPKGCSQPNDPGDIPF